MAFYLCFGDNIASSHRIFILALIALVFICSFSLGNSSAVESFPSGDEVVNNDPESFDVNKDFYGSLFDS